MSEAKGIFQSDVIIHSALTLAIADLRAKPYLLDYVFAGLVNDAQTAERFGEKERQKAKAWFLANDIPVVMDYHMEAPEKTCVSIALVESSEAEGTLADTHYVPTEDVEADWPALSLPFTPESYSAATGVMRLPAAVTDNLLVTTGMVVIDRTGAQHAIIEVEPVDAPDGSVKYDITLAEGVVADFTNSVIKGEKPKLVQTLESVAAKETYRIGCHFHGNPLEMNWLHSVIYFCLLRYKETLMEARGLERVIIANAPFARDARWGVENMWTRFINVTGHVRQSWPKLQAERVLSVTAGDTGIRYSRMGEEAIEFTPQDNFDDADSPWMTQDGLGLKVE